MNLCDTTARTPGKNARKEQHAKQGGNGRKIPQEDDEEEYCGDDVPPGPPDGTELNRRPKRIRNKPKAFKPEQDGANDGARRAAGNKCQGSRNLTSCLPGVLVGKLELKGNPVSDLATGPTPGEAPRAGPRTAALGLGGCAGPRPQHRSIAARRSDPD